MKNSPIVEGEVHAMRKVIAALFVLSVSTPPLQAQDWTAVLALPTDTTVRIKEQGGQGNELQGRITIVENEQLTLLVRGKPIVITRSSIRRIERERRDSLWNGIVLGAVFSLVMRVAFADEACARTRDPQCTIKGTAIGAGLGAFVDHLITTRRLIYTAPEATGALLRVRF
jgi:hypothetical protein